MCQGDRLVSAYAVDFCILACGILWDEVVLMDLFRRDLCNDLLLTFRDEPKSLTKVINHVVQCDNHLFG